MEKDTTSIELAQQAYEQERQAADARTINPAIGVTEMAAGGTAAALSATLSSVAVQGLSRLPAWMVPDAHSLITIEKGAAIGVALGGTAVALAGVRRLIRHRRARRQSPQTES